MNAFEGFDILGLEILLNDVGDDTARAVLRRQGDEASLTLYTADDRELGTVTRPVDMWLAAAWYNDPETGQRRAYENGETWLDIAGRIVKAYAGVRIIFAD